MARRIHSLVEGIPPFVCSLIFAFVMIGSSALWTQATISSAKDPAPAVDIVRDPADVPPPIGSRSPTTVHVALTAEELVGQLDPASGTIDRYWTFNGKVPGPMIRVRQGDMVEVTLRNDAHSRMVHSVDFHAALGPGGGAALSQAIPGQAKTFTFEATTPGLFMYHCGTPMIAEHIANGMYGLILVEPAGGLSRVDHEYYFMQGEIYTTVAKGKAGLQQFSDAKLTDEDPQYFVFNGAVDALSKRYPLRANEGETVRLFFGDAGPNETSSLHVVGEIFTRDYVQGSLTSPPLTGVQMAAVPPGSAAILELTASLPSQFSVMDHAMARMAKGLLAILDVTGAENATLMHAGPASLNESSKASTVWLTGMTQNDVVAKVENDPDSADAAPVPSTSAIEKQPGSSHEMVSPLSAQQQVVADPPEVHAPFTLVATYDSALGHNTFAYNGNTIPPLIRVLPGGVIKLHYVNNLPIKSNEMCATDRCNNMTNLHFHGLHVSPESPQDDVLTMMAMPGEALDYKVEVPPYAAPGLYWYHTHPHGESARQDQDGMSGAIIVEGIDRYYPQVRNMRERVLILRDEDLERSGTSVREHILRRVEVGSSACGSATDQKRERIFTLNGAIRPRIPMDSGEPQFWRIVNASPDLYADLQLSGGQFEILAFDGMPLSYHDPLRSTRTVDHVLLPPAGRVEAIVIGPPSGSQATLSTRCVDRGPDGDANPAMVIADVGAPGDQSPTRITVDSAGPPTHDKVGKMPVRELEARKPAFTVTFTEDKNGFYINGRKFSMQDDPLVRVSVGGMQHWRIVNATREVHPFHIHQVHFLAYAVNGKQLDSPEWLDTVNVPYGGFVELIMDFTDPLITGMSVFHCHLLSHEDKGMMAKIQFVANVENNPDSAKAPVPSTSAIEKQPGSSHEMAGMAMETAAETTKHTGHAQSASVLPAKKSAASNVIQLNGCLTLLEDGRAMLRLVPLSKTYRLEAQPFLFSQNANRLVHVTGRFGSVVAVEDPRIPSFVVDTLDELAPNCSAKITPAMLRKVAGKEPPLTIAAQGSVAGKGTVNMGNTSFLPPTITVNAGERVVWKNSSFAIHNVVDDTSKAISAIDVKLPAGVQPFDSGYLQPGQTYSRVFTVPGIYLYVCTLHEANGMKGVVIVRPSQVQSARK